jgi:hypothetical protein
VDGHFWYADRLRRLVTTACVTALAAVAITRVVPTTRELLDRARETGAPGPAHASAGGRAFGVNTAFVEWARRHIPSDARYWVVSPAARDAPAVDQWLTFRLLPRQPVESARHADAIVWYADPAGRHGLRGFRRVERYGRVFGVALRSRQK